MRELIGNVLATARTLGVSANTIYHWIKLDRVPPKRLPKLAETLDRPIPDLWHLISPKIRKLPQRPVLRKPAGSIGTLLAVVSGKLTPDEAAERLGISVKSVRMTLERNTPERLRQIDSVLARVREGDLTVEEGAKELGVEVPSFHRLRAKFGASPGPRKAKVAPLGKYGRIKLAHRKLVLEVIAGRKTAVAAVQGTDLDLRTFHRHCKRMLGEPGLNGLSHWNKWFRIALAWEIDHGRRGIVEKWRQVAQQKGLNLGKDEVRLPRVRNRKLTVVEILREAFVSGHDIEFVAAAHGWKSAFLLKERFDKELFDFRTTFEGVRALSAAHQAAMVEILSTLIVSHRQKQEEQGKHDGGSGHRGKSTGV